MRTGRQRNICIRSRCRASLPGWQHLMESASLSSNHEHHTSQHAPCCPAPEECVTFAQGKLRRSAHLAFAGRGAGSAAQARIATTALYCADARDQSVGCAALWRFEPHAPATATIREDFGMDPIRRNILATGAAATAIAAAPRVFAQQTGQGGAAMSFYEKGPVRIHYQDSGSGFPLLVIAGGGLNSTISGLTSGSPFNPIEEFKSEYRCIASDLRNANGGQSSGPLEIDRPWDSYTDDHLGLMDHLGIQKFMVMGFCIGGPLVWNLLRRAPDRVVAAVLAQPSGSRPEMRDLFYETNMKGWGPALTARRPDITMQTVEKFLTRMYRTNPDFVFTVTRDFVRNCQTPVLILPDDIPAHPYAVAMEAAMLAPKAEVSMFPWKEPKERIPLAVRQIRSFLQAHRPVSA